MDGQVGIRVVKNGECGQNIRSILGKIFYVLGVLLKDRVEKGVFSQVQVLNKGEEVGFFG